MDISSEIRSGKQKLKSNAEIYFIDLDSFSRPFCAGSLLGGSSVNGVEPRITYEL